MIIDCISDLHGHYPELDGGDLLIVAGDLTRRDCIRDFDIFFDWLALQQYRKKIVIAGNHDVMLEKWTYPGVPKHCNADYLCDSGTEFEGLKIWGSPWTPWFKGVNLKCTAFMLPDEELTAKWELIPEDTNILITHGPPQGIFDRVLRETKQVKAIDYVGCRSLRYYIMDRIKPDVHVFGHIHECGGRAIDTCMTKFVNASIMNEWYQPVNKPIRVIL